MKKLTLLLVLVIITAVAFGQWNQPEDTHFGCNHAKGHHHKDTEAFFYFQDDQLWDYDVTFYFLDIEVNPNNVDIAGNVSIHAEVVSNTLDTLVLEYTDGMFVDSAFIDGVMVTPLHANNHIYMTTPATLNQGDDFVVQVYYHGTPPSGGFFSGVTNAYSSAWDKHVTWTLSEPYAARDWFPVKQVLPDKADSCWVFLTTGEEYMAGSQGLLTAVTPMPDNKLRYEWKSKYPIAYYLISFAVADYLEYNIYAHPEEMGGDSILIQNFLYDHPNIINQYGDDIDVTADFIELFSDLYVLYPFHEEKYGHCLTQLPGGMEHQTMTTIGGFNYDLVSHELGHMWFGDNVTCATWSDIWINEGFARYGEYLARQYLVSQASANSWMSQKHSNVLDDPDGSVYVPPEDLDDIGRIFSGRLTYDKGGSIIHMIRFELDNDSLFFAILDEFQQRFADSTATGDDFKMVVEDLSGTDFDDFFNQWYYGEGYPIYSIVWNQTPEGVNMNITQETSYPSVTPLFKMSMEYTIMTSEGDTTIRVYHDSNFEQFTVPVEGQVIAIWVDPNNWVLNKVGSITVGVEETENPVFFTFGPNPATESVKLFMANTTDEVNISILDIAGKTMKEVRESGETISLNTSDLPQGSYFIRINDGEATFTRRLVKM
ncbi:MAG: M1 family aminopeptidase [Bacteroidales bacterium]|jgi:aminopeptidase N|nr:M1 family aminopeptidase [Bacteroidales bacterium]